MEKTTAVKIAKAEKFAMLSAIVKESGNENAEMLAQFIDHEVEMLAKKNKSSGSKAPSKKQIAKDAETAKNAEKIFAFMAENPEKKFTVSDFIKSVEGLEGLTPQKVRPMLKPLLDTGAIATNKEKGRSVYFLADAETEVEAVEADCE